MSSPREGTGGRGGARDPRVVRSREAALAAAEEIFLEQGWGAVTHVAVAARSGVGRTTLYRHWPDVAALLRDAISAQIALAHAPLTGELRADLIAELDVVRAHLHHPTAERAMRAVIERTGVSPAFAKLKDVLYEEGTRSCVQILASARERGELPDALDVHHAVDRLLGPLFFRRLLANRSFDAAYVRDLVDDFLHTHAHGATGTAPTRTNRQGNAPDT